MANITSSWMDKRQPKGLFWDPRHHGLGVRVWKDGHTKSWVYQKSGGKRSTLGRWPAMQVNEARRIAAEYNEQGVQQTYTYQDAHASWSADFLGRGGSPVTVKENAGRVGKHAPEWWGRTVETTKRPQLIDLRLAIKDRTGVHPARDTVGHLSRLYEYVTGERIRLPNLPRPQSQRAARSGRLEDWWPEIEANASVPMLAAHRVTALTGLRASEVLAIRRSHIRNGWLRVDNPKSKMGKDLSFDRPLPDQVLDIIGDQLTGDLVFPFKALRLNAGSYAHRLRHAYIGIAESETAVPRRVLRALVNHTGKSDVTDGYGTPSPESSLRWSQEIANRVAERITL